MKRIMNSLFLSCVKATELIEKKSSVQISLRERIQLNIHKSMCKACRMYEKQSALLDKTLSSVDFYSSTSVDVCKLKEKINAKLQSKK